jgi:hypothetical protein
MAEFSAKYSKEDTSNKRVNCRKISEAGKLQDSAKGGRKEAGK